MKNVAFYTLGCKLNFSETSTIARSFKELWNNLGQIGLNFLNIIPKLGKAIFEFLGNLFTDLFHGIYTQQIQPQKAKKVIIGVTAVVVVMTVTFCGINYFSDGKI